MNDFATVHLLVTFLMVGAGCMLLALTDWRPQ
jgi:hypothetical protein